MLFQRCTDLIMSQRSPICQEKSEQQWNNAIGLHSQTKASQLDAVASIRRGLAQARKGAGRPADEVFDELERADRV
jgi:hypothetical protein